MWVDRLWNQSVVDLGGYQNPAFDPTDDATLGYITGPLASVAATDLTIEALVAGKYTHCYLPVEQWNGVYWDSSEVDLPLVAEGADPGINGWPAGQGPASTSFDHVGYFLERAEANGIKVIVSFSLMKWSLQAGLVSPETDGGADSDKFLDPELTAAQDLAILKVTDFLANYDTTTYPALDGVILDYCRAGQDSNIPAIQAGMTTIVTDIRTATNTAGVRLFVWGQNSSLFIDQGNEMVTWTNAGLIDSPVEGAYGDIADVIVNGSPARELASYYGKYAGADAGVAIEDKSLIRLMVSAEDRTNPTESDPYTLMTAEQFRRTVCGFALFSPDDAALDYWQTATMGPARANELHSEVLNGGTSTLTVDFNADGFDDVSYQRWVADVNQGPTIVSGGLTINSDTLCGLRSPPVNRERVTVAVRFKTSWDEAGPAEDTILVEGQPAIDQFYRVTWLAGLPTLQFELRKGTAYSVRTVSLDFDPFTAGNELGFLAEDDGAALNLLIRNYASNEEKTLSAINDIEPFENSFFLRFANYFTLGDEWTCIKASVGHDAVLDAVGAPADTEAPAKVTNVAAIAGVEPSTDAYITWDATTDNVGVAGYRLLRVSIVDQVGGVIVYDGLNLNYSDLGLVQQTDYTYTVTAYDAVGNESTASDPAYITSAASPNQLPTAVTNLQGTATSDTTTEITFDPATDPDGIVVEYRIKRDGILIHTEPA